VFLRFSAAAQLVAIETVRANCQSLADSTDVLNGVTTPAPASVGGSE
jgi:hypothetical protein